jgi:hypothetical protein
MSKQIPNERIRDNQKFRRGTKLVLARHTKDKAVITRNNRSLTRPSCHCLAGDSDTNGMSAHRVHWMHHVYIWHQLIKGILQGPQLYTYPSKNRPVNWCTACSGLHRAVFLASQPTCSTHKNPSFSSQIHPPLMLVTGAQGYSNIPTHKGIDILGG